MKVTQDKTLIKLLPHEEETSGGILMPSRVKRKGQKAKVLQVGPLVEEVKADDLIVVGNNRGTSVLINGANYQIINEQDVLSIINQ